MHAVMHAATQTLINERAADFAAEVAVIVKQQVLLELQDFFAAEMPATRNTNARAKTATGVVVETADSIFSFLTAHPEGTAVRTLVKELRVPRATIQYNLKRLRDDRRIRMTGDKRGALWFANA